MEQWNNVRNKGIIERENFLNTFMDLLNKAYANTCCCISLSNFGKTVALEEYNVSLASECMLIRKEDGTKYIKNRDKEIPINAKLEDIDTLEITRLIENGVFSNLNLEKRLAPKKDGGATHFWRTGIADDDMQ